MKRMSPAAVNFAPGEEYALARRYWQGCPTICRTAGGRLFAGWYSGGTMEPSFANYNLLVESRDDGLTWNQDPLLVIPSNPPEFIAIDIQLWLDPLNRMWVFWVQRALKLPLADPGHLALYAIRCDHPDEEKMVWSSPVYVTPGFLRCQPTVLSDGRWLLPAYDWTCDCYCWSESSDQGESWVRKQGGKKLETPFDEGMFFETGDGGLHLYARSAKGCIAESVSADGGKSWSDGTPTAITAPSSRLFVRRLASGNLLLVCNDHHRARRNLTARLSVNDGKSWPYSLLLDATGDALSYPDGVELDDGSVLVIYDNGRGSFREIRCARFTENDLRNGELCVSDNTRSYLANLISKAPVPRDRVAFEAERKRDQENLQRLNGPDGLWGSRRG